MAYKVLLRGSEPSGRMLALLCARTGDTIDRVRAALDSSGGLVLAEGLSRESAVEVSSKIPEDSSVDVSIQREIDAWTAVLVGYRPGNRGRLRVALQKMSRLSTEEVIHFLASIPVALKKGVPRKTAEQIRDTLQQQGAIIEIRPFTGLPETAGSSRGGLVTEEVESAVSEADTEEESTVVTDEPPGTDPELPPEVQEIRRSLTPVMNVVVPDQFFFEPPEKEAVSAPPYPEIPDSSLSGLPVPHSFRFTVPRRRVPSVKSMEPSTPPVLQGGTESVAVYLHPVSAANKAEVCRALSQELGIPVERCSSLASSAPVAVWASSDRLNALVMLRNLTERGVPVSLFSGHRSGEGFHKGDSFFGWLNGTR